MDTVPKKYVSRGYLFIELVYTILLTWYGVSFFHCENNEVSVSDILAYVLSWLQHSIISGAFLFCIYVYNMDMIRLKRIEDGIADIKEKRLKGIEKSIVDIKDKRLKGIEESIVDIKDTRLKGIEKSIVDIKDERLKGIEESIVDIKDTRLKGIEKSIVDIKDTRLKGMEDSIEDMKNNRLKGIENSIGEMKNDIKEDMKNFMNTGLAKSSEQMQRILGAMLGNVKPDVRDPGEMLRQFKKTFMQNIIFVSNTGQEKADIQKKADIVFTWLDESQFSLKDVSAIDLGIEGNALELLVRGGHMYHALDFDWEKCSLTVLPYIAQEYDNMLSHGHIDLVKGVLDLCKNDIPREDVTKKAIYRAASIMIDTDYGEDLMNVCTINEWVGIRQCLKNIHKTLLKEPISDARSNIRKHTSAMPEEKFNSIFERIFVK